MKLLGHLVFVFSPGWLTDGDFIGLTSPTGGAAIFHWAHFSLLYCMHRSVGFLLKTSFFLSLPRSNKAAANDFKNHSRTIVDIDTYKTSSIRSLLLLFVATKNR